MPRAELVLSLRNAMSAEPVVEAAASPEPSRLVAAAAPSAPAKERVTWRRRLFGRFADYGRRYLTASLEHRLDLVQGALDRVPEALGAIRSQLQDQQRFLEAQQRLLEAQQQAWRDQREEMVRLVAAQAELIRRLHSDQREGLAVLSARSAQLEQAVQGVPALLGPRLDELEIKVRPLIAFDEESYAVRLRDGYAMIPRDQPMFAVMVANATSGGLEPGTRRVLQALATPGSAAADVGANVGLLTLALGYAVGPAGRVYAFEPEPGPRRQLEKTLRLNGLAWVEVFDCALGVREATAVFHISPVIGHSSLYPLPAEEGAGRDLEVRVRRLDEVVPPGQPLDVVKIDVEGAELDVLAGMSRLLAENPDIALVAEYGPSHLARVGIAGETWFGAFAEAGFTPYAISEPDGACRRVTPSDVRDAVSVNLAFVRPGGAAEARLPR